MASRTEGSVRDHEQPVDGRGSPLDVVTVIEGAIAGTVAFAVGLVATLVVGPSVIEETELFGVTITPGNEEAIEQTVTFGEVQDGSETAPSTFEMATWLYHKAHFGSVGGEDTADLNPIGETTIQVEFLPSPELAVVFPIVVLVGAGFLLAKRSSATTPVAAAQVGATAVAGYGIAAVASAVVVTWTTPNFTGQGLVTITVQPDFLLAVSIAGVAYPVVLGGAGGYLQHIVEHRSGQPSASPVEHQHASHAYDTHQQRVHPQGGYQQTDYQQPSHQQGTYHENSYQHGGYQQEQGGYQQGQSGHQQEQSVHQQGQGGYHQGRQPVDGQQGQPQGDYQQTGQPRSGYEQSEYEQDGYNQSGHGQDGYEQPQHPQGGYQQGSQPQDDYQQPGELAGDGQSNQQSGQPTDDLEAERDDGAVTEEPETTDENDDKAVR